MNVVIIEDEPVARDWSIESLRRYDPDARVIATLETVEDTVQWFSSHDPPDLVLADIELADGNVFTALHRCPIACPIVFVTAYDRFVLQAFEDNGIAYVLKPVSYERFVDAMRKFERLGRAYRRVSSGLAEQLRGASQADRFRERLVVRRADGIALLPTEQIAYVFSRDDRTTACDRGGIHHSIAETLTELEGLLDPARFFRVHRSAIVHVAAIERLVPGGGDRLELVLRDLDVRLVASAPRIPALRRWLAR
jgi:DNA-binding LytR/AlgR family response regulator